MAIAEMKIKYLDGSFGVTQKIKKSIDEINNKFIYIGFLLWEVRHYKYYLEKGYESVVDYAEKELNFRKSTTYNFIKVCEKFSKRTDCSTPSMFLADEYSDYKYGQLVELSTVKDLSTLKIEPTMSVREIKEVKKDTEKVQTFGKNDDVILNGQLQVDENLNIVEVQFAPVECASSAPNDLFNDLEYKKLFDLIDDRYKLIDNFIVNEEWVAPSRELFSERDLLEKLLDKIKLFKS